ncbi:structural cement protein Gp24 [Pseudomonas caspiana]
MAVQDTYSENMRAGVPGQIVDTIPKTLLSRTVEAAGGIGLGVPAARGTADKSCRPFAAGDTVARFIGITVLERSLQAEANAFKQYDSVRVMTKGAIWVTASVVVGAGDPVYVVPASGLFTNASAGNVQVPNAVFDTSTTAVNQIAQVRLG